MARSRLLAYCREHLTSAFRRLKDATADDPVLRAAFAPYLISGETAEDPFKPYLASGEDSLKYMLLRPLGIPGFDSLGCVSNAFYPQVAYSPGEELAAYAWVSQGRPWDMLSKPKDQSGDAVAAVLDVSERSTGQHKRVRAIPWPGWTPTETGSARSVLTWLRQPYFGDVRWSRDGKYLSFTTFGMGTPAMPSVTILETRTWKEAIHIPDALDAFVVPAADQEPE